MQVLVYLKGKKEPVIYSGDRIDILDFSMNGVDYKQIRYFRKGFSKSVLVEKKIISKININIKHTSFIKKYIIF